MLWSLLMAKLKSEVYRIVACEIITKITEPTEFVNPTVIVKKPDNI